MPEKSVREMNALERRHFSLAAKTFRASAMGCALLGLVALIVGLGLYALALSGQFIRHAFDIASYASVSATHGADSVGLAEDVMTIYRGLSEEDRQKNGTQEYRDLFSSLNMEKGSDFDILTHMLRTFVHNNDVDYVYIAMYDEDTCAMVYVVDPDETEPMYPGEWESVTRKGMRKFLDWDGTGILYDIDRTEKYGWMCTAGVPLRNGEGEICAFLLADVTISKMWAGMRSYALQVTLAVLAITALVAYVLARYMRKRIAEPVNAIADAAVDYVRDKRAGEGSTDHFSRLDIHTGDEVENLCLIMADMERDLKEIENDLTAVTAEKERIGTELSLANRIQAAMLPHIFPPFPDRKEIDIFASMDPAKEVGGDFYDFFLIDADHLGLVVADVSGKGIPAALYMMTTKIILQSCAMLGSSPAEILTKTNEAICSNNQEEMFITVWVGILDLNTGELTAANAGHEYPILKTPAGKFEVVKDKHGFVIGGMDGMKYREYRMQLAPGAKLFLYTDGLPEAADRENRMFGMDRVLSALNETADSSPRKIVEHMNDAVDLFVGNAEQFDDLTMLCVHYLGKETEGGSRMKELTLEARVENIDAATDFINGELKALGCPMKVQTQIDIALDEVLANVASYAYPHGIGEVTVRLETETEPRAAVITILDRGIPFDPLKNDDPDVTLSLEEREIGGLGVFLVKKTMDEVSYEHRDGKNILRLKKVF